jgi:hypothetical protein
MGQSQFSRSFASSFDIHRAIASAAPRGKQAALAEIVRALRREDPEIEVSADLATAIRQGATAVAIGAEGCLPLMKTPPRLATGRRPGCSEKPCQAKATGD